MAHSGTLIYMRNVPGRPDLRALTLPLELVNQDGSTSEIPAGFYWDGSSAPAVLQAVFPRHNHPIASCRHDWRCKHARNGAERKWADQQFEKDVGTTSWWITKKVGYLGVRIGAMLGIGVRY